MGLIYLDSCVLIYAIEDLPPWTGLARAALASQSHVEFMITPLVMAECLVGPLKREDPVLVAQYHRFFAELNVVPISEAAYLSAAAIRARHGLKLQDALHLACAEEAGCDALWTNDNRLSAAGSIAVALIGVN